MQVLPQIYGGAAAMVPIEQAVSARLVMEGLQRATSSTDSQTVEDLEDAEGRLTRAGRYARCFDSTATLMTLHCLPHSL